MTVFGLQAGQLGLFAFAPSSCSRDAGACVDLSDLAHADARTACRLLFTDRRDRQVCSSPARGGDWTIGTAAGGPGCI